MIYILSKSKEIGKEIHASIQTNLKGCKIVYVIIMITGYHYLYIL